jgi:NarL family two-component system response regulator YdfI
VIRVFIVAAAPLARAGLENLLAARDVEVVGSAAAIEILADQLSDTAPDVVLIDSSGEALEPMMGSILASGLASDVAVAILADGITPAASTDALRAGIRAALPGDISPEQLVAALQAVASGLLVLHPSHAEEGLAPSSPPARALEELAESLTSRELEVLQMLATGLSNKEIATRLNISEHTVKFHVASILGKLGAGSRTEAVALGIRRGLVLL